MAWFTIDYTVADPPLLQFFFENKSVTGRQLQTKTIEPVFVCKNLDHEIVGQSNLDSTRKRQFLPLYGLYKYG